MNIEHLSWSVDDPWNGYDVDMEEVSHLWPLLHPTKHDGFGGKLYRSIRDKGLKNPLVVCRADDDEVAETFGHRIGYRGPPPDGKEALVVVVGNQRWHVANALEIPIVPIVVVDSIKKGLELESKSRDGFRWLYRHD